MCIKIGELFSVLRVVGLWCGIKVSAAAFINNGCELDRVPKYGSVD